ncbi:MAG: caspase family protein [Nannocystaceae bacterium]
MLAASSSVYAERRRALLIGCPVGELVGVENSLARLAACLLRRRFAVTDDDILCGPQATCEAIARRLARFVDETRPGDAVVLVYVGHGATFGERERSDDDVAPARMHLILPIDYHQSAVGDSRFLTGVDLSDAITRIAEITQNVTVILDCCHAAGMIDTSGDPGEAWREEWNAAMKDKISAHIRARSPGPLEGPGAPRPIDAVVRLVASSTTERAYQRRGVEAPIGLFIDALAAILDETEGRRTSWGEIVAAVQRRVAAEHGDQWVGAEGPRERVPFSLETSALPARTFPCGGQGGQLWVDAGRIHGVAPGDLFVVRGPVPEGDHTGAVITEARAVEVGAATTTLELVDPLTTPLVAGATATRERSGEPPILELAIADGLDRAPFLAALRPLGCLVVAPGSAREPAGRITITPERVALVEAPTGETILEAQNAANAVAALAAAVERLVTWLERAEVLAATGDPRVAGMLAVSWGVYERGDRRGAPLPYDGAQLPVGARLWLELRPTTRLRVPQLHCAAFRVTAAREYRHLTAGDAHGAVLQARSSRTIGSGPAGARWVLADWDYRVPRTGLHTESLLVFASTRPLALHTLASPRALPQARALVERRATPRSADVRLGLVRISYQLSAR